MSSDELNRLAQENGTTAEEIARFLQGVVMDEEPSVVREPSVVGEPSVVREPSVVGEPSVVRSRTSVFDVIRIPPRNGCLIIALSKLLELLPPHAIYPNVIYDMFRDEWGNPLDLLIHGQQILDLLNRFGIGAKVVLLQVTIGNVIHPQPSPAVVRNDLFDPFNDDNSRTIPIAYSCNVDGSSGHFRPIEHDELTRMGYDPDTLKYIGME